MILTKKLFLSILLVGFNNFYFQANFDFRPYFQNLFGNFLSLLKKNVLVGNIKEISSHFAVQLHQ